jgi:hypothetical protein
MNCGLVLIIATILACVVYQLLQSNGNIPEALPEQTWSYGGFGSRHQIETFGPDIKPTDWTYELVRHADSVNNLPITDTNVFNTSYLDNWTLGRLVKKAPQRSDCYQFICPKGLNNANCWRCGK